MAQRCFLLLLVLSAVVFYCCTDDEKAVNPSSHPLIIGDLIHFDTTVPIMVQVYDPSHYPLGEPYICREGHIGEPFIDVNGDGIFTWGWDIFIVSAVYDSFLDTFYCRCDSIVDTVCFGGYYVSDTSGGWDFTIVDYGQNQDINHNGKYDGPDDYWTPGLPYDDFDGDGTFDFAIFYRYVPGLPFADINGNGVCDTAPLDRYSIEQYRVESLDPWDRYAAISIGEQNRPHYRYVSDIGKEYTLEGNRYHTEAGLLRFVLDSTGFWYTGFDSRNPLLVFAGPEVHSSPRQEIQLSETRYETRTITFNESLDIRGRRYTNLVCVDIPRVYSHGDSLNTLDMEARFYFAPNTLHLIAARLYPPLKDSVWIFLDHRFDTLPLPMIR